MANSSKITLIVERLLEKTKSAEVRWASSGATNAYIARLGEHAFQLTGPSGNLNGLLASVQPVMLEILRQDGSRVARVISSPSASPRPNAGPDDVILPFYQAESLKKLFQIVSSGDSDLDAILKSLQ